jgi:hypothetical protein
MSDVQKVQKRLAKRTKQLIDINSQEVTVENVVCALKLLGSSSNQLDVSKTKGAFEELTSLLCISNTKPNRIALKEQQLRLELVCFNSNKCISKETVLIYM